MASPGSGGEAAAAGLPPHRATPERPRSLPAALDLQNGSPINKNDDRNNNDDNDDDSDDDFYDSTSSNGDHLGGEGNGKAAVNGESCSDSGGSDGGGNGGGDGDDGSAPAVVSPPYWQMHQRAASQASVASTVAGKAGQIRLQDNSGAPPEGMRSPLWARVVRISEHAVVAGAVRGVGDYVVWICHVDTYGGGTVVLRRRYSEFEALRAQLRATFPYARASLPALPPKSVWNKFRPAFLEKRRLGLEYFLNCVLLNPEFASSVILKDFVFG